MAGQFSLDLADMHSPQRPQHKRNKSSVLKALVSPIGHKRNASEDRIVRNNGEVGAEKQNSAARAAIPQLQRYHSEDVFMRPSANLQSRVIPSSERSEKSNNGPGKVAADAKGGAGHGKKRSAANLAGLLSKAKSYGNSGGNVEQWGSSAEVFAKDKENTTPPTSAKVLETAPTPIFSQFTSPQLTELSADARNAASPTKPSHMATRRVEEESFYSKSNMRARPQSDQMFTDADDSDEKSTESGRRALQANSGNAGRPSTDESRKGGRYQHGHWRIGVPARRPLSVASALSVQQSVKTSAPNNQLPISSDRDEKMLDKGIKEDFDAEAVNTAFEKVLDARNIPENMRQKMRTLNLSIKADFVRKNSSDMPTVAEGRKPSQTPQPNPLTSPSGKHATTGRVAFEKANDHDAAETSPEKRSRVRSRTFTLGRGESLAKKQKPDRHDISSGLLRPKETQESSSSKSLQSITNGIGSWGRSLKQPALPGDFVAYLRKVQKPEVVEVGRIHKLRLLLRNETVSWVHSFIESGGMTEVVGLVHRILEIEWREEHEDHLLHESLLCLKGLCTTDMAQQKLCDIDSKLFPALLATLFDKEHKGPSEFTTRSIIINLLFAHLSSALGDKARLVSRAHTILSYLRDPQEEESSKPLEFILEMQQPRPYRVWCREITNVTKEVFWIFIHQLNVIPLDKPSHTESRDMQIPAPAPASASASAPTTSDGNSPYTTTHYPPARPPVPAAPYVGGVEWDATNYLAAHLDLLNGLLASLPTAASRNALRAELRLSGFEKVMGSSLRTCKEKFYGSVHAGLRTWAAAAAADGWSASDVRAGPKEEIVAMAAAARRSPAKKKKKKDADDGSGDEVRVAVQPLKLELDNSRGRDGDGLGLGLDLRFESAVPGE